LFIGKYPPIRDMVECHHMRILGMECADGTEKYICLSCGQPQTLEGIELRITEAMRGMKNVEQYGTMQKTSRVRSSYHEKI